MPTLIASELEQARQYFDATRRHILKVTDGLSDAQFRFKPDPNRWSIAEILEHMVIVHERILTRVMEQLSQAPAPPADRDSQLLDTIVLEKIPDRSIKAQAPEFIHPTGKILPEDAIGRISSDYERLIGYLESAADLREHILESPPLRVVTRGAYDTMDGYQWVLTAACHDERHTRQMEEVKETEGYPE